MAYARFTCPYCGSVQDPLVHTLNSNCRGKVYWEGSGLRCERCGQAITKLFCDHCSKYIPKKKCVS